MIEALVAELKAAGIPLCMIGDDCDQCRRFRYDVAEVLTEEPRFLPLLAGFSPDGSLTAARLRLADAAEKWNGLTLAERVDTTAWDAMRDAYDEVTTLRAGEAA